MRRGGFFFFSFFFLFLFLILTSLHFFRAFGSLASFEGKMVAVAILPCQDGHVPANSENCRQRDKAPFGQHFR